MPDLSRTRKHLKLHGISWEEKCWLLYDQQSGKCAICLQPLEVDKGVVDHDHGCRLSGTHRGGAGCRECIRGVLCFVCNSPVLMYMERYPHLQNAFVGLYLARRPFMNFGVDENKA